MDILPESNYGLWFVNVLKIIKSLQQKKAFLLEPGFLNNRKTLSFNCKPYKNKGVVFGLHPKNFIKLFI